MGLSHRLSRIAYRTGLVSAPMSGKRRNRSTQRGFGEPSEHESVSADPSSASPLAQQADDAASQGASSHAAASVAKPALAKPARAAQSAPTSRREGSTARRLRPRPEDVVVEVEHVHEHGAPALIEGPWRAIEIWTRNRIYGVDSAMMCRSVTDRSSDQHVPQHPTLGARLLGGQGRAPDGRIHWVSHPLPTRGGAAVFATKMGKRLVVSETSDVTRVLVRQRVVEVGPDEPLPAWEEITGNSEP